MISWKLHGAARFQRGRAGGRRHRDATHANSLSMLSPKPGVSTTLRAIRTPSSSNSACTYARQPGTHHSDSGSTRTDAVGLDADALLNVGVGGVAGLLVAEDVGLAQGVHEGGAAGAGRADDHNGELDALLDLVPAPPARERHSAPPVGGVYAGRVWGRARWPGECCDERRGLARLRRCQRLCRFKLRTYSSGWSHDLPTPLPFTHCQWLVHPSSFKVEARGYPSDIELGCSKQGMPHWYPSVRQHGFIKQEHD
jgi:hypothetical protein